MKKFISAVTSLAMTVTMASSIAPSVSAADASKGFAIKAYAEAGSKYDAMGSKVTVSKEDIAAGDVVVPVAVYLDEATPDTEAVSVAVKLVSDSKDVANVTFRDVKPTDNYFAEKKEYTAAGKTFSSARAITFAGKVSATGSFTPAGSYEIAADKSQKEATADYAYIGCSWTNNGAEYKFSGEKSTDHPFFVFDVTLPKGSAAGDYKLQFCKYNTDFTGTHNNPTPMIETKQRYTEDAGNLKLEEMTITVEGDNVTTESTTKAPDPTTTTTSTTKAPDNTTTTTTTPKPNTDADVVFDFGNYEVEAGKDDLIVGVTVDSKGKAISAMDVVFKIDSPLQITEIVEEAPAFNTTVMTNMAILGANFKSLASNGDPLVPTTDHVFDLVVNVPATTPDGNYNIGFGNKCEVHKSNDGSKYTSTAINGVIKVGKGGDTSSTTKTPDPTTTTTSTTKAQDSTTTTSTTTPQPSGKTLKPTWGDVNCDGEVNVADVVLLNKWLNNNADYAMTDQGKVNADCFNPQDANGGAVDASKVDLTKADSDAIIRSVVHLITLPAKG